MRIVFWGTPDFAVTTLAALFDAGREIVGVVTQPDRPSGRGRKLRAPPVKEVAERHGVPLLQPERPRGLGFMESLGALRPDISVVAAYGHILVPEVLELPRHGSINVHASLLPRLRGAAPVNWAIIRGHAETGVTVMRMVEAMDAGPIILQATCPIASQVTAGDLHDDLADRGARLLVEALDLLESGQAVEQPQDDAMATYAPKISTEDARIDWSLSADEIDRWIRGTDPTPGAWSIVGDSRVRLFAPNVRTDSSGTEPGTVVRADPQEGLEIAAGCGSVRIGEVQPAGKRRMEAEAWIRGRGVSEGQRFR